MFVRLSNFARIPFTLFPNKENSEIDRFPFPVPRLVLCFNTDLDFPPFAPTVGTCRAVPSDWVPATAGDPLGVSSRGIKKQDVAGD